MIIPGPDDSQTPGNRIEISNSASDKLPGFGPREFGFNVERRRVNKFSGGMT